MYAEQVYGRIRIVKEDFGIQTHSRACQFTFKAYPVLMRKSPASMCTSSSGEYSSAICNTNITQLHISVDAVV